MTSNLLEKYDGNGYLHNSDGPALINSNGNETWYRHGRKHREDGPSVMHATGLNYWFLHGIEFTFGEWLDKSVICDELKLMMKLEFT